MKPRAIHSFLELIDCEVSRELCRSEDETDNHKAKNDVAKKMIAFIFDQCLVISCKDALIDCRLSGECEILWPVIQATIGAIFFTDAERCDTCNRFW